MEKRRGRQGARRRATRFRRGAAQGDLREADQARDGGCTDYLSLSPPPPVRAHQQARRLQTDARWAGARDRAEAEVRMTIVLRRQALSTPLPLAGSEASKARSRG